MRLRGFKNMTDNENKNEEIIKSIFQEAEKLPMDSDPFMKTRILAELRIAKERKRSLFWKISAFASPAIAVALLLLILFLKSPSFNASVDKNILVKIEVKEMKSQIAFAQIELPEGVHFYSKLYPEISKNRKLVLAVDDSFVKGYIPIIVKSEEAGSKKLTINFLDANQKSIEKRYIKIKFTNAT